MNEPETVHSAREVAEAMGISGAMVRRYAAAYEEIAGEEIPVHRRDGRQYSQEQLEVLLRAKGYVDANAGMSVDTALRLALGRAEMAVKVPPGYPQGVTDLEAFSKALEAAVTQPLLEELRGLRGEVAGLKVELHRLEAPKGKLPQEVAPITERVQAKHGFIVRLALRLERLLQGRP